MSTKFVFWDSSSLTMEVSVSTAFKFLKLVSGNLVLGNTILGSDGEFSGLSSLKVLVAIKSASLSDYYRKFFCVTETDEQVYPILLVLIN